MVSSLLVGLPDFLSSATNRVAPPGFVVRHHPEFLIAEVADFFDLAFSFPRRTRSFPGVSGGIILC